MKAATPFDEPIAYGRYRLLALLGQGSMTEAFKAKSFGVEGFEKTLVVKRVRAELASHRTFVAEFVRQAQLAVRLSHANVVQVFDLGQVATEGGTPSYYLATEYVAGMSLRDALRRQQARGQALPLGAALFAAAEIAKGLDHAHRRRDEELRNLGIVHGDVGLRNVALSWEGEVKLTDFGVVRAFHLAAEHADPAELNLKCATASPELLARGEVSARSDLFALGSCLYELLTAQHPFLDTSVERTNARIQQAPKALASLRPDLEPRIVELVEGLMAADPAQRPDSAARVYEDLVAAQYVAGERFGAADLADLLERLREESSQPRVELPSEPSLMLPSEPTPASPLEPPEGASPEEVAPLSAPPESVPISVEPEPISDAPISTEGPSSEQFRGVGEVLEATPDAGRVSAMPPEPREKPRASERPPAGLDEREVSVLVLRFAGGVAVSPVARKRARTIVERYGARVFQETARDLVGVFGLQEADGRDTETAVRCALVLLRVFKVGEQEPALAIDSGRLRVEGTGEPARTQATREVLMNARRLASVVEGTVSLTERAAHHLGNLFELEAMAAAPGLHGRGWLVGGERSLRAASGRFVGRQPELRALGAMLAKASRRKAQAGVLLGESGIGKTRLLWEMERRISRGRFRVACHICQCPPRGRDLAASGVMAMVRTLCGVQEGDSAEGDAADLGADVTARLRALGLQHESVEVVLRELGLEVNADLQAGPLRNAITQMFESLSKEQLHVFCWDNARELDAISVQILSEVLERLQRTRILLLFAARTDARQTLSGFIGDEPMELGPLEDEDVFKLAATRLRVRQVPETLLEFVRKRAGGHPLFIEELLRQLRDSGAVLVENEQVVRVDLAEQQKVPRPLRSLLSDRVRQLAGGARRVLIAAAVLGEPVDTAVLAAMVAMPLSQVNAAVEVLVSEKLLERDGPVSLSFPSQLVPEVLLAGLEGAEAEGLHSDAANAYQMVLADRTEAESGRVAHHLALSGQQDRAAGFFATSGLFYLGQRRLDRAVEDLTRALELADIEQRGAAQLADWISALSSAARHVRSGRGVEPLLGGLVARVESDSTLSDSARAELSVDLAQCFTALHRYKEAGTLLSRIRARLERADAPQSRPVLKSALIAEAEMAFRQGNFTRAIAAIERCAKLGHADDADEHRMLIASAQARAGAGQHQQAVESLQRAAQLSVSKDPVLACERAKVGALILGFRRDWEGCAAASEAAAEMGREAGLTHEVAVNLHNQGDSLLRAGDHPHAYACLQQSAELADSVGADRIHNLNRMMLAYLDALNGLASGERALRDRLDQAHRHNWTWDEITGRYLLGRLLVSKGQQGEGRRQLEQGRELAKATRSQLLLEDCEMELAALS